MKENQKVWNSVYSVESSAPPKKRRQTAVTTLFRSIREIIWFTDQNELQNRHILYLMCESIVLKRMQARH